MQRPGLRRLFFLLVLVLVVVAGLFVHARTRADRWRPLHGGGEIRFLTITYSKKPRIQTRDSMLSPLYSYLGQRWPVFRRPHPLESFEDLGKPTLVVWFHMRLRNAQYFPYSEISPQLVLGDQIVTPQYGSGTNSDRNNERLYLVVCDESFKSQPRLHVRWLIDDESMDFDVTNPFYTSSRSP